MSLKFIDFCSGTGAARIALESLSMNCVAHSEIDPVVEKTYRLLHNDENNLGDLTSLDLNSIPDCDLLIAGFPCQSFSIAGKRQGLVDIRGQIIYSLSKILKYKNISYFILENVKGLINHNKGNTLNTILQLLNQSGYKVFFKVLNSFDFNVSQFRERIYFVGIKKDRCNFQFQFPQPVKQTTTIKDFLLDTNLDVCNVFSPSFQRYLNNKYNKGKFNLDQLLEKDYLVIDTRQSDLRIYQNKFPTLRTNRHGLLYVKNKNLHRLSGKEAFLLQGFSKSHIKKLSSVTNTTLLSQAGNAMTINVIQAIGKKLLSYINGELSDECSFSTKRIFDSKIWI